MNAIVLDTIYIDQDRISAWLVCILVVSPSIAYLLSFINRQVLALLIEPIKANLRIGKVCFRLPTDLAAGYLRWDPEMARRSFAPICIAALILSIIPRHPTTLHYRALAQGSRL